MNNLSFSYRSYPTLKISFLFVRPLVEQKISGHSVMENIKGDPSFKIQEPQLAPRSSAAALVVHIVEYASVPFYFFIRQ
jgi:hypothetical protein